MPLLALLVVAAAPLDIAPLGFSVQVEGDAVVVRTVKAGSVAQKAGLTPGFVVERVVSPQYLFGHGPLAQLPPEDLATLLTPPHGENLTMLGRDGDGRSKPITMARTDPAPANPFPDLALPAEKVVRLSLMQQSQYRLAQMMGAQKQRADAEAARPPFELDVRGAVEIGPDGVHTGVNTAVTPEWIYFDDRLRFRCQGGPMRSIEMTGPSPVAKVVATSTDKALQGGSSEVQLPLWRTKDAIDACRRKQTTLPSVTLTATLRCEGKEPRSMPLSAPLTLSCVDKAEEVHLDALRIKSPERVVAGTQEPVLVSVWGRALRPPPTSAAVIELDDKGKAVKRWPVTVPAQTTLETTVPVDLSKPRTVTLALEVKFPDGSIDRSTPKKLRILSAAAREEEDRAFQARTDQMFAVNARLTKVFPDPCADPEATVKWLRAQPEVSLATNHEGHNLSYVVGELPMIVMCHDRE